jgi:hypothetical protein
MKIARLLIPTLGTLLIVSTGLVAQVREKRVRPVDDSAKQAFEKQLKVALLVGIGDYPKNSGLSALKYPAKDVAMLSLALEKQGYAVRKLIDAEATRGSVRKTVSDLLATLDREQGTFLFYFSGHGFAQGGQNYLATFGSTADDLSDEGLPVNDVQQMLKKGPARQTMMFIDACRNETRPGARSSESRSFSALQTAQGLRVLYSTREGQVSYESDKLQEGVFTYFLLEGLKGEAAGADGLVTFRDLTDYMVEHVRSWGVRNGLIQVPYEAGESSGDFLLAKSVGAPVLPTPPPTGVPAAPIPKNNLPAQPPKPASLRVGRVEVSQLAGLHAGDSLDQVSALFGEPHSDLGNVLMFSDQNTLQLSVLVEGGRRNTRISGVVVYGYKPLWVRARAPQDPLMDLLEQPASKVLDALGQPTQGVTTNPNATLMWKLPAGGDVTAGFLRGVCTLIGVNWPKQPAAKSGSGSDGVLNPQRAMKVRDVDVSKLGGLGPADTKQTVAAIYGKPNYSQNGDFFGPEPERAAIYVEYAGNLVKGVTVYEDGPDWVRVKGGAEPILDLLGKTEAEITGVLGIPFASQTLLTSKKRVYWGFSKDGGLPPSEIGWYKDSTVTLIFEDGKVCTSIGIRW